MTGELLLEIGTEEIPAGFIPGALSQMKGLASDLLSRKRLAFESIKTVGTPRRLTLIVSGLPDRQEDASKEIMGPPKRVAFDDKGNPAPAAAGFAKSQGVDVSAIQIIETPKGEYLLIRKEEKGESTKTVLAEILPQLIQGISFPKSMHWGCEKVTFARPVHWILAIYAGEIIPFSFGSVHSGNLTHGHRFMAPEAMEVKSSSGYLDSLKRACVIADPEERKSETNAEVNSAATRAGGFPLPDPELLDLVTDLVEYPSAVCGTYDKAYLSLPRPVLITAMREHQKYFAVLDDKGALLPYFVAVNNTPVSDPAVVARGHERVLRARLQDASFFFAEDLKTDLATFTEELKGVIFHSKLGTSYEKVMRIEKLAVYLAGQINPGLSDDVRRAAFLCKADLLTAMVGEFPTLQGVMGREYALLAGEKPEIADAILEHYKPAFSGDRLPQGQIGCILSTADKMDTVTGGFAIGLAPSGTTDPYALRRQSLAILNIIMSYGLNISLRDLISHSTHLLKDKVKVDPVKLADDVFFFFRTRFQYLLADKFDADVVEAVTSVHFDNIPETQARIEALQAFKKLPDFESLSISFKRVVNISRENRRTEILQKLLQSPAEKELFERYASTAEKVKASAENKDYLGALKEIAGLKGTIDRLFDEVMVMDKDLNLRQNRLNLLTAISDLFKIAADFSKVQSMS